VDDTGSMLSPRLFVLMAALVILIAAFEKYRAQHIKPAEHHHSAKPYLLGVADGRRESAPVGGGLVVIHYARRSIRFC
jgi:branched-subunit amino acid permease